MSEASANERERLEELLSDLERIRGAMVRLEDDFAAELARIDDGYRESARNLLHYLALRHEEVRPLQERLAALGLSSLGRSEAHVLATVDAVAENLHRLIGRRPETPAVKPGVSFGKGAKLLAQHTQCLLGPRPNGRKVRIMVTLPGEAAADYPLVRELLDRGMDCARINTAHDDPAAWERMAANVRTAARELKRNCRVQIDLAGPKLRTGAIEPGPRVIEWHPQRDTLGRVTSAVRIWLTPDDARAPAPSAADVTLPIAGPWISKLCEGDAIEFDDAREAARTLRIVGKAEGGYWAECRQTCYVTPDTTLQVRHRGITLAVLGRFGEFPPREQALTLKPGDTLIVTPEGAAGKPASYDEEGRLIAPAVIPCTLSEVFPDVRPGERIWFDDGKIGGLIQNATSDRMEVLITQARAKGAKLRADRGINLPDSNLSLPALTAQDIEYLPLVVANADLVGMSFVRRPEDVRALQAQLERLGGRHLGIVLKIETRRGFERLPNLLLALMRHSLGGVMIARGDLAIECGYERLAELQEEILWICEAAHMPVIWATQVLESLTKGGMPSRAEITDAAMGERSECVMLNKGPHMVQAVSVLDNILRRMQEHQSKKTSQLRPLHLEPVHLTD
jgi:pyruvate kinase